MKKNLLLALIFISTPAHGMVYTWTDSAGVAHFTNKDYEIPARYRAKVKSLYPEQSDTSSPQQNVQPQPAQPAAPAQQPQPVQQAMPEEQQKAQQPAAAAPPPPVRTPEVPVRRGKRHRTGWSSYEE